MEGNLYNMFLVERGEEGQSKTFVWALDSEDAIRQTSQRLGMYSSPSKVTQLTNPDDLVMLDLVLS